MSDEAPPEEPKAAEEAKPDTKSDKKKLGHSHGDEKHKNIIVVPRAKVVFLWPLFIACLISGFWTAAQVWNDTPLGEISLGPGRLFCWTFFLNMLALGFDFTRGSFVALILSFAVVLMGIILLDQEGLAIVEPLKDALGWFQLRAHHHVYFLFTVVLALVFIGVWIEGHFDYWEIAHNEVLHHKGFLGDVKRYPAHNLQLYKELPDLFEYCLYFPFGGAGRIVLTPHGSTRAFVLDNVIGVNKIEDRVKLMLASLQVKVDMGHGGE